MQTNLIVQCKQCKHQYKVNKKRIGQSFHCFCGETLTIPKLNIVSSLSRFYLGAKCANLKPFNYLLYLPGKKFRKFDKLESGEKLGSLILWKQENLSGGAN